MTKKKLLTILLIVLVVLLAAGTAAGLWLGGVFSSAKQTQEEMPMYWNLEHDIYVASGVDLTSGRMARGGEYHITFGCNGEKVELICADKTLVDQIDMREVMGLELDENGYIVGVKSPAECGYTQFSGSLYVTGVEGNTIHTNNSATGRGLPVELTVTDKTQIYDVTGGVLMGYMACQPEKDDELVVLKDSNGDVSHIFVKPLSEIGDVYWNIDRQYDSTTQMSTRTPDALGYYTYVFILNGEQVTLKTRDMKVANDIDKSLAMGLEFDEEGLITKKVSSKVRTGGGVVGSYYDVVAIEGNMVTLERTYSTNIGKVVEFTMRADCKVYNVCDSAPVPGELTELRLGDRVQTLTDDRGMACLIFVVANRPVEGAKIGWNIDRQWDSTNKVSTRKMSKDGLYHIKMAIGGQIVDVKTDNIEFINKIDSFVCYGVKLDENNMVEKVCKAQNIYNRGTFASYYFITKIENGVITAEKEDQVQTMKMSPDCVTYDVSQNSNYSGEVTTPQVGDKIHGFPDANGVRELYVVSRPWDVTVYWNIDRQYDSKKKETKRVPDEDGYYWFEVAGNGRQYTLKTRSKEIANGIDSSATKCKAFVHWNGEITKLIGIANTKNYSGSTQGISYVWVTEVNGNVIKCENRDPDSANYGKIYTVNLSKYCKVYNVDPDGHIKFIGEPTTVQVGDKIQGYHNANNLMTLIYVLDGRTAPLDTTPNTCPCEASAKWEPWDGTTELKNGKYYYLTADVEAPAEGFVIEGMKVNLRLDGHTISSQGRCFWIKANGQLNICDHDTRGKLVGNGVDGEAGGVIRIYTSSGTKVNLWNIDVVSSGTNTAKEGGIASVSGPMTAHNCSFSGGKVSEKGGIFQVSTGGTLRTFDCTISGGSSGNKGGNLNVQGRIYMENTTVTGGKAGQGGNINMDSSLECVLKDVTVKAASGQNNICLVKGQLDVTGKITVTGGTGYNVKIMDGKLSDAGMTTGSSIGVTADVACTVMDNTTEEKLSCFTLENFSDQRMVYADGAIVIEEFIILKEHTDHCLCAGNTFAGGHSCTTVTGWQPLTKDLLEETTGTGSSVVGVKLIQSGKYYLPRDLELAQPLVIPADQDITLCLNGCDITSSGRAALVAGVLTITDCGSGTVTGASSSNGGCIKVLNGGTLNIYDGTYTDSKKVSSGGGGVIGVSTDAGNVVSNSTKKTTTFNFYGGTITGGNAASHGGCVGTYTGDCVFNMYGGTIKGGTSGVGGNVSISGPAKLLGGTITGGTGTSGNDVGIRSNGQLTVGGKVTIGQIYIPSGKTIKVNSDLNPTAPIGIMFADSAGAFATGVTTDMTACFQVPDGYSISYNAEEKTLNLTAAGHAKHCVCNNADLGLASHSCDKISNWKPLTEELLADYTGTNDKVVGKSIPAGNYYLPADLSITAALVVPEGVEITVCLNGCDITSTARVAFVAGTLTITDCADGGKVTGASSSNGGCIKVLNGGTLNIYGGTYTDTKKVSSGGGGVIGVSTDAGNIVDNSTKKTTTFNLYGGTITGGNAASHGGCVGTYTGDCVFNMYGGTIKGGTSKVGGNVSVSGPAKLLGGTITGGSGTSGNDVGIRSDGKLTIGGQLTIGDIYLSSGKTVTIHSGGLSVSAPILIKLADGAATFATNVATDLSGCFQAAEEGLNVVYDAAEKTLTLS